MNTIKQRLGQFNTTNSDYILSGFEPFLSGKNIVDPFAGNGDLLRWASSFSSDSIGYDVDETKPFIHRDTLLHPLNFSGKWVLTNPPYLARNKCKDKTLYDAHQLDDLYKIAIKTFCDGNAEGGIVIVPVNFLSAETSRQIRNKFFASYDIKRCVVFEETVFDDTDYTVCAFYFERSNWAQSRTVPVIFKPSGKEIEYEINESSGWVFGEEYYQSIGSGKGIGRFTVNNYKGEQDIIVKFNDVVNESSVEKCHPDVSKNIILLRAIDTGTSEGRIKLYDIRKFGIDCLVGLKTSRNWAHLRFDNPPTIEEQVQLIDQFNSRLEELRSKYNSIFLTAFRNSTKLYSRKRISFDAVYGMLSLIYMREEICQKR